MSIKITCDVCGKEINVMEDCRKFDSFDVCQDCRGKLEKFADDWRFEKRVFFGNFLDVRLRRLEKPSKPSKPSKAELPYVHTKDIKPNARLRRNEIVKCGKGHVHVCRSEGELPAAATAAKPASKPDIKPDIKPLTARELADELHCKIHTLQCFALRNEMGTIDPKRRIRVFNPLEVECIRIHFKYGRGRKK